MVANSAFGNQPNIVWTNDGNGIFTDSGQELGNNNSSLVALGDLDGDGDLDAMVANNFGDPNIVWTNDGNGTFTDSGQALGSSNSYSVALGDLDGDGALDAMVSTFGDNTVWTNDGTGTFTNSGQALGNSKSSSVALGDLDGDGDLDAMFANFSGQPNTVWTNTVTGAGICCAPSGCAVSTQNLAGYCEQLGGIYIPEGSCDDCPTTCNADLNDDGVVDAEDLAMVLAAWGRSCDN